MCVEKTPWEQVIEFHGHSCPGIALGFRIAQIAQRELGIRPTPTSECLVKCFVHTCAVDAFQVINHATFGRKALKVENTDEQIYQFHYTGSSEILQISVSPQVQDFLSGLRSQNLSPREKQNKSLEGIQYILSLEESSFCTLERINGVLEK